jgi:hypothetical protein
MRVTIETTVYEPEYSTKVSVEVPYDDVEISKAFEMCADALEAFGFTGAKKYLEGEE